MNSTQCAKRMLVFHVVSVLLSSSITIADQRQITVQESGKDITHVFEVEEFDPPLPITLLASRPASGPVNEEDVAAHFFSAIMLADAAWYEALWHPTSYAQIDFGALGNFDTWSATFDQRTPELRARVEFSQFTILRIAFAGEAFPMGQLELSLVIPLGQLVVSNEFAGHPVLHMWDGPAAVPTEPSP